MPLNTLWRSPDLLRTLAGSPPPAQGPAPHQAGADAAAPLGSTAPGRSMGFIGAKGGVGTTVLTTSLAWALAQQRLRVVVLDLNRHGGQAALHLCERNAGPTLREALQVIDRLDDSLLDTLLTPCSDGLRLLPSPRQWLEPQAEPVCSEAGLQRLLRHATALADVVLVDLPGHALGDSALRALLPMLDERILVSEPTLPSTYNARRLWSELQALLNEAGRTGSGQCGIVLNKVHRQQGLPSEQVRRTLDIARPERAWRELPRSEAAVAQATYQGQAVGAVEPRDPLARALSNWAAELAAQRAEEVAAARVAGGAPARGAAASEARA